MITQGLLRFQRYISRKKKAAPKLTKKARTILTKGLSFKQKELELSFSKSLLPFKRSWLLYFISISMFWHIFVWTSNSIEVNDSQSSVLAFNLIMLTIGLFSIVIVKKKRNFKYSEPCLFLLQICLSIGYSEATNWEKINPKGTNFTVNGIFLEISLLIPMLSQCSWKVNTVSSFFLNMYLNLRLNLDDSKGYMRGSLAVFIAKRSIYLLRILY
jgi:hypothetical protein